MKRSGIDVPLPRLVRRVSCPGCKMEITDTGLEYKLGKGNEGVEWRYECPRCGVHRIVRRRKPNKGNKGKGKE